MKEANLTEREAGLSVLAGSILLLSSLTHRGLSSLWRLGVGSVLVHQGVTRHSMVFAVLGIDHGERKARELSVERPGVEVGALGEREVREHKVDIAVEESFPASDAPSFMPGTE